VIDYKRLGAQVHDAWKASGLHQGRLLDEIGMSRSAFGHWQRGFNAPSLTNLERFAEVTKSSLVVELIPPDAPLSVVVVPSLWAGPLRQAAEAVDPLEPPPSLAVVPEEWADPLRVAAELVDPSLVALVLQAMPHFEPAHVDLLRHMATTALKCVTEECVEEK
jgi:transcriptional regulator with XRE-family HTH domain